MRSKARVAANPKDHEARVELAQALFATGDKEGAVDQLLESIRINRAHNEEAARKQLVTFFEAMGPMDPLTLSARRRLSSLLFSVTAGSPACAPGPSNLGPSIRSMPICPANCRSFR